MLWELKRKYEFQCRIDESLTRIWNSEGVMLWQNIRRQLLQDSMTNGWLKGGGGEGGKMKSLGKLLKEHSHKIFNNTRPPLKVDTLQAARFVITGSRFVFGYCVPKVCSAVSW